MRRFSVILFLLTAVAFGQELPFLSVTGPNAPGGATALMPDTVRGGLWLGGGLEGNEALVYFDGNHFVNPLTEKFPKALVYSMAEDTEGGIWLTTSSGLYRALNGHIEFKGKSASGFLACVAPNVFLTNSGEELLRVNKDKNQGWKVERIAALSAGPELVKDPIGHIFNVLSGGYAEIRVSDIVNWQPGQSLPMLRHEAPQLIGLKVLTRDSAGCWWGRRNGFLDYECPGGVHASQKEREQMSGPGYGDIFELKDGSIVVAQYGKLLVGRPGRFRMITALSGYPGAVGTAITRDGSMWFSNGNGLFVFPTKLQMEVWTEHEGLDGNAYSVVRTAKQTLAIAGSSLRVLDQDRGRWTLVSGTADLPAVRFERGEEWWQLTSDGKVIRQTEGASADTWTCTLNGLRHNNIGWKTISTEECRFFAIEPRGDVWLGSNEFESGFALLENPGSVEQHIRRFESGGEVGVAKLRFLGLDRRGWIWRGSPIGVYVADAEEARQGRWLYLNKKDGIGGTDANQHSFFSDPDGSVWFGVDNSVNHLSPPADFLHPTEAPDIFVSGYSLNGGEMRMADMVGPVASGSSVTAHVGSLQFDRRNALRIRYRVLPEQTAWQESKALDLGLGVLPAGEHTVEVQGRVFTGPWSGTARNVLRVLRPVWTTGPYLFGYAGVLALAGAFVPLLRWKRRREERLLMPDLRSLRTEALLPEGHELTGLLLDERFEVGTVLARGGFATVLDGYDRAEKRRCAIKVFRGELKSNASVLHGFGQEVRALRQIRHPSVVAIYADGVTAAGAPYVAMEFIEGQNLRDVLRGGPLTTARTGRVLAQLANALDAIHARGICHRDVKPENVMLREAGVAVLIDFSIAIIKDVNETMHGISRAAGTFDYMAPEQALGYAEPASDVFSLAKLVIELLCGQKVSALLPNTGLDLPEKIPQLLKTLGVRLSEESVGMLARALAFDPKNRPGIASEFAGPIVRDLMLVR